SSIAGAALLRAGWAGGWCTGPWQPCYGVCAMTLRFFAAIAVVAFLMAPRPAQAHHSFAAEFDINKPVTLQGVLTKMEWVNPHGWIYVDVKAPDGQIQHWAIEAGGPTQLLHRGLRKDDFPAGIEVTITD